VFGEEAVGCTLIHQNVSGRALAVLEQRDGIVRTLERLGSRMLDGEPLTEAKTRDITGMFAQLDAALAESNTAELLKTVASTDLAGMRESLALLHSMF
jgi:hypothetical protein